MGIILMRGDFMIISVCSPDKISINMFANFLMGRLGKNYKIAETHSLMSIESINEFINGFIGINGKDVIFTFYSKRKMNVEPEKYIPAGLINSSDAVVWFNLYSTAMIIVKDKIDFKNLFELQWKQAIDKLGKIQLS